ncbi:putative sigma-54 modulation protein [Thermonema lapsum]|jgi:putative sigma-54 modulation protein|uniref:Putative sigma-54 modulation protein n=1 Tax=Thermonema lapsum TaxID=28195 RepID=A0A846MMC2_9BACT|nr:ribosome-associated translation inhibitor RaiA [Thermonema lapsum]NIK72693.1 putative sigma-54 modulation protein [Thermonema lapsum]
MKVNFQSVHFKADQKLLDFVQEKLNKLDRFYDRIVDGEVIFRLDKGEHGRENKVVEIKLNAPGHSLFSKSINTSFEAAAVEVVENLRRQILKLKEKETSH